MSEPTTSASTPPLADGTVETTEAEAKTRSERLKRHSRRVRVYTWTAVLVVTIVILVALIAANTRRVKVSWVFGDTTEHLVWIILVAALVGWVSGIATGFVARRRIWRDS